MDEEDDVTKSDSKSDLQLFDEAPPSPHQNGHHSKASCARPYAAPLDACKGESPRWFNRALLWTLLSA